MILLYSLKKLKTLQILDRSEFDISWVGQPFVLKEESLWRMLYLSCDKWEIIYNQPEPFFHVM